MCVMTFLKNENEDRMTFLKNENEDRFSDCRQRKFSQPLIQNKQNRKSCPNTQVPHLFYILEMGFKSQNVHMLREDGYI